MDESTFTRNPIDVTFHVSGGRGNDADVRSGEWLVVSSHEPRERPRRGVLQRLPSFERLKHVERWRALPERRSDRVELFAEVRERGALFLAERELKRRTRRDVRVIEPATKQL